MNSHEIKTRTAAWERVFEPAIQAASKAMSVWTNGRVTLSLDDVRELPLDEITTAAPNSQETTIVVVGVDGAIGGEFLISVDDDGAAKLASLLLHRPVRPPVEWGEIERSALMETGNIIGSAYLSALTALSGRRLFPTPPALLRDYLACVLQQAVLTQAVEADLILLARTCFHHLDERIDWNMLFIPSSEMLDLLRQASLSASEGQP